jgi:hypothetical protein
MEIMVRPGNVLWGARKDTSKRAGNKKARWVPRFLGSDAKKQSKQRPAL